ncbi:MAG TPA: hypothetical protein VKT78_04805 [Fimbriimonadaceae bacterium]|nr:hypothetical protein [Fimbriimonadaceae bacterium]
MRTTIDLPDDLFRQAKASAALRGIKLRELITECVSQGLAGEGWPAAEEAPKRATRTFTYRAGPGPVPGLSPQQIAKIFNEDEARVYLAARRRLEEKGASPES